MTNTIRTTIHKEEVVKYLKEVEHIDDISSLSQEDIEGHIFAMFLMDLLNDGPVDFEATILD